MQAGSPELKAAAKKDCSRLTSRLSSVPPIRTENDFEDSEILASWLRFLLSATMALAACRSPPLRRTYPDAPDAQAQVGRLAGTPRSLRRPNTQAEFDAYKAAASLTDPVKLEAAAIDFAQRFPDSELRSILFQQAMGLYQQANDPVKTLEMARVALKYDPSNPVALLDRGPGAGRAHP